MELRIRDGDYVAGANRLERLEGTEAMLQRVLYRLTARRGSFPFLEEMGSRLHTLGSMKRSQRAAAAKQFVAEALREEDVTLSDVRYDESEETGIGRVSVSLLCEGESYTVDAVIE